MAGFVQDAHYGLRLLRKSPVFLVVAVATLSAGIGATTAIFSVVYSVLLQPLPYAEPQRLVTLWTAAPRMGLPRAFIGGANYMDWRAQNQVFEDIAIVRPIANFNLTGTGQPERLQGARISANLPDVLGARPMLGRGITEEEQRKGAQVALLSYGLWQRRFGADRGIVGRLIRLNGEPFEVVGVMGPDFRYPTRDFELWTPLFFPPDELQTRLGYNYLGVARLKPGTSLEQARAEMNVIAGRLARQYPDTNAEIGVVVEPLLDSTVGSVRTTLYSVLAAVGCLLLIGCANLASLMFTRATVRGREMALRAALGASRGRLARQLLSEIVPLVLVAAPSGLLLAQWMMSVLVSVLPAQMPRAEAIGLHAPVLVFATLLSLAIVLMVGALPALQASRADLAATLKQDARTLSSGRRRIRDLLVVSQVAVTLALLFGAGLLVRSLLRVRSVHPGFQIDGVLTMHLAIPRTKYSKDREVAAFCGRVMDRVRTVPGVETVGMINRLPLTGVAQTGPLEFEGANLPVRSIGSLDWRTVTPDYFRAMRIPLVRGRLFTEADSETQKPVGIIDERIARQVWPNDDPIGKRFRIALGKVILPWTEIIGVVGHIRNDSLEVDPRPQVYWNYLQRAQDRMALVLRTQSRPEDLASSVIARIHELDPEQPVYDVRSMSAWLDRTLEQRHLTTGLIAGFGLASLLLASLGLYGVVSYAAAQRIREFGIRVALGAQLQDVRLLVLGHAAKLALAGTAVGLALALAAGRLVNSLLFGVHYADALVMLLAPLLLVSVVLAAAYLPARRATRIDPVMALRNE